MGKFLFEKEILVTIYGNDSEFLAPWEERLLRLLNSTDKELTRMFKRLNPEVLNFFGGRHALHTTGAVAYILERMGFKPRIYHCILIEDHILYNHCFVIVDIKEFTYMIDMGRGHHRVNPVHDNHKVLTKWKKSFLDSESLIRDRYLQCRGATTYSDFQRVPLSMFVNEEQEFFTGKRGSVLMNDIIRIKSGEIKQLLNYMRHEGVII